jgi:hypothetical protein
MTTETERKMTVDLIADWVRQAFNDRDAAAVITQDFRCDGDITYMTGLHIKLSKPLSPYFTKVGLGYTVRVNSKGFNPILRKLDPERYWEVEQEEIMGGNVAGVTTRDSEPVIWHCAEVRVNGVSIKDLFDPTKIKEMKFRGAIARGAGNAIEITERTEVR